MRYVQTPGSSRKKVTLALLGEFLEEHTHRERLFSGEAS